MGKKADLLLKQLVEKDNEIELLRGMLNGGVSCRAEIRVTVEGRLFSVTKLQIRTAWDGMGVETDGGDEWILNPFDVLGIEVPITLGVA